MPKKTAVQHLLSGYYRPSRHGPLPGFIDPQPAPAPEDDDRDSPWKHELRLPRDGETRDDVWRKAMEYRAMRCRDGEAS
jgi:hypothetical protein